MPRKKKKPVKKKRKPAKVKRKKVSKVRKRQLPTCPECGGNRFIEDPSRGELICAKCGLLLKEGLIDTSQEWRAFDSEQMSRRA